MNLPRRSLLLGGAALLALPACATDRAKSVQPLEATHIVVRKAERALYLMQRGATLERFDIALGSDPLGHKQQEGDGRTPEGAYFLTWKNPRSRYHLSVGISYPSTDDVARARKAGLRPGGDIYIHGQPPGIPDGTRRVGDWTAGCIAVSNTDMERIYASVHQGLPILIRA